MKKISIFGSTGEIGKKAIEIAKLNNLEIIAISANENYKELIKQAKIYNPKYVCISNKNSFEIVKKELMSTNIKVLPGSEINNLATLDVDILVMAISGISGLLPTFKSLGNAKRLAIATKEVIISGGDLLIKEAKKYKTEIIPIDSEHNSIFQCIANEDKYTLNKLIITASGGPFINYEESDLKNIKLDDALNHPKWIMGKKNTIDSATLINKSLEIIEAAYLFDFDISKIEAIIHPESIIHAIALFNDNVFKSILHFPDMKIPISFAINYPYRKSFSDQSIKNLDFLEIEKLSFKKPKSWQIRNINLAYQAFNDKKVISFNISNEIAVKNFIENKLKFCEIYSFICDVLDKSLPENINSIDDILDLISYFKRTYN